VANRSQGILPLQIAPYPVVISFTVCVSYIFAEGSDLRIEPGNKCGRDQKVQFNH